MIFKIPLIHTHFKSDNSADCAPNHENVCQSHLHLMWISISNSTAVRHCGSMVIPTYPISTTLITLIIGYHEIYEPINRNQMPRSV